MGTVSRRDVLKAAAGAAAAAALPGCLGAAMRDLPSTPARWPAFRFVHAGGLRLSVRNPDSRRWAMEAARAARSLPEIDFLLLTGDPVAGSDPFDLVFFEEFLRAADLPCYAVSGKPAPASDDALRHFETTRLAAWRTPWAHSPVPGVQLVGLSPSPAAGPEAGEPDPAPSFLASVADGHPEDCLIVLLPSPARVSGPLESLGIPSGCTEEVRFVLEAAAPVKLVVCGGTPLPFTADCAGLVHLGTPGPAEFPRILREITVAGNGVVAGTRALGPEAHREKERQALPGSALAKRFHPSDPGALGRFLEAEMEEKTHGLR